MAANVMVLPAVGARVAFLNARTQGLQTAIVEAVYPPLQDVNHSVIYAYVRIPADIHIQGRVIVAIMLEQGGGRQEVPHIFYADSNIMYNRFIVSCIHPNESSSTRIIRYFSLFSKNKQLSKEGLIRPEQWQ
ncbi:hypothetical protein BU17DRAFT_70199 [Hysterangium stoloniferum]|nr:hypothetical protein BU17DRAFT_70199 [Hysterangium stoloniferum]